MATCISRLLYSVLAWFGFCKASDIARMNKVFKRGCKLGYLGKNDPTMDDMIAARSTRLFNAIQNNDRHVLHPLLPEYKNSKYNLRKLNHGLTLPPLVSPFDERNFLLHMLYL